MHKKLTAQFKGDGLKATLMRGGLVSLFIKIIGLILSLVTAIVLARILGPEQYGIYSYVLAIVSILAIPATFGLPSLIVRETAKAEVKQDWGKMRGLWSWSNGIAVSLSVTIALITLFILWLSRNNLTQTQLLTYIWGVAFIPLSAMAALRGASLRGLRKVIQGQLPEQVLKPCLFAILLALVVGLGPYKFSADTAMMLNVVSFGVVFIVGAWLLVRAKPKELNTANREFEKKAWIGSVAPLAMISGLEIIITQTDIVMLGWFKEPADVGLYRVSLQGAQLVALGVSITNMIVMPYMSQFATSNDYNKLSTLVKKSARAAFFLAFFVTIIFFIFGEQLISLAFGDKYLEAYFPLLILSFGQLIHAGLGAGGTVLNMCGFEKGTLITLVISSSLNVVLNSIFIPIWGMEGAATATFIAIVFRKIMIWLIVFFKLKIDSSILGINLKSRCFK